MKHHCPAPSGPGSGRTGVEVAGIEPASSGTAAGLLRAQLAVCFSALPVSPATRERAQPRRFTTRPRGQDGWWSPCRCQVLSRGLSQADSSATKPRGRSAGRADCCRRLCVFRRCWLTRSSSASSARFPCPDIRSRDLSPPSCGSCTGQRYPRRACSGTELRRPGRAGSEARVPGQWSPGGGRGGAGRGSAGRAGRGLRTTTSSRGPACAPADQVVVAPAVRPPAPHHDLVEARGLRPYGSARGGCRRTPAGPAPRPGHDDSLGPAEGDRRSPALAGPAPWGSTARSARAGGPAAGPTGRSVSATRACPNTSCPVGVVRPPVVVPPAVRPPPPHHDLIGCVRARAHNGPWMYTPDHRPALRRSAVCGRTPTAGPGRTQATTRLPR